MIYVDANIFYNYLFKTELTEKATDILEENKGELVTSFAALEEAIYVVLRKLLSEKSGIRNRHDARKYLKTEEGKGFIEEAFTLILAVLFKYGIEVIEDVNSVSLVEVYAVTYGLMPRDAQILATCILNGVSKLATFDADFQGIPEIELVQ